MGEWTSPGGAFSEGDLPVAALESREIPDPSERSLPGLFSPNCREFGRRWHKRQYTASAFYPISHFDLQTGGRVQENIHSRAKLDQSDSFSPFYSVACFFREHNPSRQKARDLLEFDPLSVAFHGDDILLILFGGS